ncbi:Intimin [compost metagenome]
MLYVSDIATKAVTDITADKTTGVVAGKDVITLKATVKDENDNPVSNAEVYWGSDNDSGTFAPDDTSVTNALGVAEITYSATSAVPTVIGAGVNSEYKTLGVDFTGDASTSLIAAVQADKTKAVADNAEQVTWHAVAKDANGNALPGVTVNWSSDNADLKLSGVSSVTDATGTASISGYTAKAGDFLVTATIVATGKSLTAAKVSFVGDVKTAGVSALISDKKTVAANNSDSAKYSVTVKDVNGNLVPDATVVWTTSMNTLSVSSSQTDANGSALVNLTGATIGQVTVTATIGSSTRKVDDVVFVNNLDDLWVVNSGSSEYDSPDIKGFSKLGFVTVSPTTGPTTLDWAPEGYAEVATPITLVSDTGKQYTVNLKGYRQSVCTRRPLNAAVICADYLAGIKAIFTYDRTDNPGLPAGHYMGVIHFAGKDWDSSYTFNYKLTMDLTVN